MPDSHTILVGKGYILGILLARLNQVGTRKLTIHYQSGKSANIDFESPLNLSFIILVSPVRKLFTSFSHHHFQI